MRFPARESFQKLVVTAFNQCSTGKAKVDKWVVSKECHADGPHYHACIGMSGLLRWSHARKWMGENCVNVNISDQHVNLRWYVQECQKKLTLTPSNPPTIMTSKWSRRHEPNTPSSSIAIVANVNNRNNNNSNIQNKENKNKNNNNNTNLQQGTIIWRWAKTFMLKPLQVITNAGKTTKLKTFRWEFERILVCYGI